MNPIQIYESFIIKANKNAQTDNTAVDKGRFAKIFNEASNKFVEWILDKKSDDDPRYIQPLLTTKKITESTVKTNYQLFSLPKDYFDMTTISCKATGGCCTDVSLDLFEIKSDNDTLLLSNSDTEPSIEYRESLYHLQSDSVKIYVNDFKVDSIELTYYKRPSYIFLIDEEDPESTFKNPKVELNLSEQALDRIISIAISDFDLNNNNPKYQMDKMREVSKN